MPLRWMYPGIKSDRIVELAVCEFWSPEKLRSPSIFLYGCFHHSMCALRVFHGCFLQVQLVPRNLHGSFLLSWNSSVTLSDWLAVRSALGNMGNPKESRKIHLDVRGFRQHWNRYRIYHGDFLTGKIPAHSCRSNSQTQFLVFI